MLMNQQTEDIVQKRIEHLEQQRDELLEALKLLHRNFRSQHANLLILGAPDFVHMDKVADSAITRAEAA